MVDVHTGTEEGGAKIVRMSDTFGRLGLNKSFEGGRKVCGKEGRLALMDPRHPN